MRQKAYFYPKVLKIFKEICLENRFATTKVIKSQLQDINVNASERTVRRKLKHLNFKTCCPARKLTLTPAMKAKRLNWAKQWRDKDVDFWRPVCFCDERTFELLQNKAQFVRLRRGEKFHSDCVIQTVKHPTKIMIWSIISGKGRLYVVKILERMYHVWNHHPQMLETVQFCIDSMPRRIEALIAAKGGSRKY
ncbi:uncharacterized protein TNCV_291101 [Trichonephila clavipes]|nr:uncharacterized protein TNCV_291101 [Trichonephila clavipes]